MDIERLISHTSSTLSTLPPPQDQHHDAAPQYPQEIFVPTSPISSSGSSAISSVSPTITTVPVSLQNQQGGGPIRHHNRHHHHHNNQKLPSLYSSPLAQDAQITNGTIPRTSPPSHHLPSQDQHHSHVHHSTQTPNRRLAHILSEQKRRENINSGFEELKSIVPSCRGCADSKAVILRKAVHYIQNLELEIQKLKHNSIPSTPSPSSSTPSPSPIINNKQLPVNGNNNGSNGNNLSTNGFSGPLPPIRIGVNNGSAVLFENENQKFDNLYKQQPMMPQEQPYQFEKQHQFNDQWRPPMNNNNNNSPDQPVAYMHNGNATNHHASFDAPQTTNNMKQQQQQQQQNSEYRFRPNPISNSVITKFHPDNNYSPPRVNTNPDDERHFKNEEMDWRLKPNLYNELPLQQQQQQQQPQPPLFIEHRPCCRNHNPPPSSSLERILVKQEEITGEIRTMVANRVRM